MLEESCSDWFFGKIWGNILYNRKPWFSRSNTEVKLTCWKHKTERWKYHQRQSAATPTYTRELGSHNRYMWKVPITRHPKGWEVQCPKWSMSVQSAKGSDTESTLMICLTSKRWAPQQPKLSSHTCHTWYLWQREGPPFPQKKDTAAGSQTWQTKSTDPWSEDPWFISGVISGGFQTKRGWFSLTLPPRQLWVRKKQSHAETSWPVVVNKSHAVLCKMENYKRSEKK